MFYPTLNTMRKYRVDDFVIRKLDAWLGTRRKAVRKFLNPLQFSIDTDIDEDLSIDLFVYCTQNELDLLNDRYVVECPNCSRILGTFNRSSNIPISIFCNECNRPVRVHEDMVSIWFELSQFPETEYSSGGVINTSSGDGLGKAESLRPNRLLQSSNDMARRLISDMDKRLRSS